MLSQRKKYNYMVNSSTPQSRSTMQPLSHTFGCLKQNQKQNHPSQIKIEQLQSTNRKLVEETTKQFKKLEEDVQRVENILHEKEQVITEMQEINEQMREEKCVLIEAIYQKDHVIREFQKKIQELLQEQADYQHRQQQNHLSHLNQQPLLRLSQSDQQHLNLSDQQPLHLSQSDQQPLDLNSINLQQKQCQTDTSDAFQQHQNSTKIPLNSQSQSLKSKYHELIQKALKLEDEVYNLKQELYDAHNEIKMIKQEHETYKILKQIENTMQK